MSILTREQMLNPKLVKAKPPLQRPPGLFDFSSSEGPRHFWESFQEEWLPIAVAMKLRGQHYTDAIARERLAAKDEFGDTPGYDPAKSPYVQGLPPEWREYAYTVTSEGEARAFYETVMQRQEELNERQMSGGWGTAGYLTGAITNPGGLYAALKVNSLAKMMGGIGILGADEILLHQLQPERTPETSVMAVGGYTGLSTAIMGTKRIIAAATNRRVPNNMAEVNKVTDSAFDDLTDEILVDAGRIDDVHSPTVNPNDDILHAERNLLNDEFYNPPVRETPTAASVGAARTPDEALGPPPARGEGEELVKTRIGLENMPDSPVKRILQKGSNTAKTFISHLVEHPFFQVKNLSDEATAIGVDRKVAVNWIAPMVDTMKETQAIWLRYRERVSGSSAKTVIGQQFRDLRGRDGALSFGEFLEEVGRAKRGLTPTGTPHMIDEVTEAANLWHHRIYKRFGEAAQHSGMFSQKLRRELWEIKNRIWQESGGNQKLRKELEVQHKEQMDDLTKRIQEMDTMEMRPDFLNRIYRKDMIRANIDEFKAILAKHGRTGQEADDITNAILNGTSRNADEDIVGAIEEMLTGRASSLKERQLGDIPDAAFGDFLESNIFALAKYYTTRVGPDVELTRAFGSIDMHRQITAAAKEWDDLIKAAPESQKARLIKRRDQELEDIKVVRDRIRGTYGLPDNPDSWTNRGLRLAKMHSAVSYLTGAIAAVPDVGRLVMYDGMVRSFGTTFDALVKNIDAIPLAKAEAQLAGEALDMYMSMRAAIFADLSDALSATSQFERMAATATQQFFNVSLMNPWNVGVKTMASLITGSRIIDDSINYMQLTQAQGAKLARAGISDEMAGRIATQFEQFGLSEGKVRIARTAQWTDRGAANVYLAALGKEINTIIVTPGKGEMPNFMGGGLERFQSARRLSRKEKKLRDEPLSMAEKAEDLFMSPQMAQVLFQFKSFGIAATSRVLVPGLQQPDLKFVLGAGGLVALGVMIEMIREKQLGRGKPKSTAMYIRSGIDRSGVLGWFSDINGGLETLSDGRFGIAPLLGDDGAKSSLGRKLGLVGGPTFTTAQTASKLLSGLSDGEMGRQDSMYARRLLPLNRTFWADGIFDNVQDAMVTAD
tara:strand:- start:47 stop:3400 length:3354 start_codon:yes stop_codon:yes gene_type:complete